MNFGRAIESLKEGLKVSRYEWIEKGMWLVYVPGSMEVPLRPDTPYHKVGLGPTVDIEPHIDMYTAQGTMQPGWLASQEDMLAEDWGVVVTAD